MNCLKLKSLKQQYVSKGDIQKYWMLHYRRKAICKNKRAEQVSGEPFSLFQQHCINHITKHKKESFRNRSLYLTSFWKKTLVYVRVPGWRLCTAKCPVHLQSPGQRLEGRFLKGWTAHLQCVSCSDASGSAFSPLGGLIQRPVKSLGASPLTSISFESSFAFPLLAWLFSYLLAPV